ncbi:hypothetical protein [uncultured Microscilla sp.]|uniref:hypothetical protein n=1 Tax=uncultured Microscilla sp. TaxID=432653 RepID=UPI002627E9B3|nr:hypothetical protein [uncultured Microscilla sp.]
MKTSHKILLIVVGFVGLFALVGGWMLRLEVKARVAQKRHQYRTIDLSQAPQLELRGRWQVTIQQGSQAKLSLAKSDVPPVITNTQETIRLKVTKASPVLKARITLPTLKYLRLANGTTVVLQNFKVDSLAVRLSPQASFTGRNNEFVYLQVKPVDE